MTRKCITMDVLTCALLWLVFSSDTVHTDTATDYRCYSCSSKTPGICSSVNENTTVVTCKNGCTKIRTQPLFGAPTYFRGCSASPHFIGCESINLIGNMKMECDCRNNLCNHGNRKMVPGWAISLSISVISLYRCAVF